MEIMPAPRANFEMLPQLINKKVLLVAKIESASGMEARVKTADGGTVTVALAKPPAFQSDYVEFEGIVNTPTTFTEIDRATFGNKFDMNSYNQLCNLSMTTYQDLFR